jgi:hypothetical protein
MIRAPSFFSFARKTSLSHVAYVHLSMMLLPHSHQRLQCRVLKHCFNIVLLDIGSNYSLDSCTSSPLYGLPPCVSPPETEGPTDISVHFSEDCFEPMSVLSRKINRNEATAHFQMAFFCSEGTAVRSRDSMLLLGGGGAGAEYSYWL